MPEQNIIQERERLSTSINPVQHRRTESVQTFTSSSSNLKHQAQNSMESAHMQLDDRKQT